MLKEDEVRGERQSEKSPPRSRQPDGQEEAQGGEEDVGDSLFAFVFLQVFCWWGPSLKTQSRLDIYPPTHTHPLTQKQVCSDGVKQRDAEITGEDDKHRVKVWKKKREEDCVCASAWNKPDGSCQLLSDERADEELQSEIARRKEGDEEMTAWAQVRSIEAGEETWTSTKGGTGNGMRGGRDGISYSTGTTTCSRYTQQ